MKDDRFTLEATEDLIPGRKVIHLAVSHGSGSVAFMTSDGSVHFPRARADM